MTEELKEIGLMSVTAVWPVDAPERHIVVEHANTRSTTDSNHKFNIAPNLLDRDFTADRQTRNGQVTSAISGRVRAGCISL